MLGVLEFVDEGDRVVLEGNTAVALCVDNQVVFAQAEFTCALARLKKSGRAEVGPIDAALFQLGLTPCTGEHGEAVSVMRAIKEGYRP